MAATHFSGPVISAAGFQEGTAAVNTIAAATTLTADDSGKIHFLNAAGGAAVTLPAPVAGMKFRFVVAAAFATTDWTIVTNASANIIQGGADVNGTYTPASNEDTITFVSTLETLGDYVELVTDGTNWFVEGAAGGALGITFTAT